MTKEAARGPSNWKEVLAKSFVDFFLSKPDSAKELFRRFFSATFIFIISMSAWLAIKHPELLEKLAKVEIYDGTLTTLFAHDKEKEKRGEQLLRDFYDKYNPDGMLLVSWDSARTLTGLVVRPLGEFPLETGSHELPPYFRDLAGPLIFEECEEAKYTYASGRTIFACPIANKFAVWGYVAFLSEDIEKDKQRLEFPLKHLASKLEELTYPGM